MYCVGLTGTIASGKSTVAAYFSKLGVTVFSADLISKQLTAKSQPAFQAIINHFGGSLLTESGELDRKQLRHLIFQNPDERRWLEALLHPLIQAQMRQCVGQATSAYCIIEIPLLSNTSNYPYLNRVLWIKTDYELQITRVMARDHCSNEHAHAILATQADEQILNALADDIIINNGSLQVLENNVKELHQTYLRDAFGDPN